MAQFHHLSSKMWCLVRLSLLGTMRLVPSEKGWEARLGRSGRCSQTLGKVLGKVLGKRALSNSMGKE